MRKIEYKSHDDLLKLGFERNRDRIKNCIPHYKKGNDLVFIIQSNYSLNRIYKLVESLKNHEGNVYGVLTENSPRLASLDFTYQKQNFFILNPITEEVGDWNGNDWKMEWEKYKK